MMVRKNKTQSRKTRDFSVALQFSTLHGPMKHKWDIRGRYVFWCLGLLFPVQFLTLLFPYPLTLSQGYAQVHSCVREMLALDVG